PSTGKVSLFGQDIGPYGRGPWDKVGHLVELPSAYPELTVHENLEIARRLQNVFDPNATTRIMDVLALLPYKDRKAGTLSMGNLQRLGLARALLHEPEILILDEPANGLDPAGVVEIRTLLGSLAKEKGITIFMSSHILTEVDRLATRIGIIHQGRLIEELDAFQLEKMRVKRLAVKARNLEAAQFSLQSAGYKSSIRDGLIMLDEAHAIAHPDDIAQILVNAGTPPTHLAVIQENLEDHFLRLTNEN
ncbi:MAG TPA: ABC transporter ATP-binding protein, partial [Anaerolineales bacterium]|nr:ABC transporter ATP-binding protein [Anaerolineales bacterium]